MKVTELGSVPISTEESQHIKKLQHEALKECAKVANKALSNQSEIAIRITQ